MKAHSGEGDHGFRRMATIWSGRCQAPGGPRARCDNNRQVFVEPSLDEDGVGDDSDGDFASWLQRLHSAGCEGGDFHHAQNWCRSTISCEDRFPLIGN